MSEDFGYHTGSGCDMFGIGLSGEAIKDVILLSGKGGIINHLPLAQVACERVILKH